MAGVHDIAAIRDIMIVLATAAIIVPLLARLSISPILAFFLAGAVLGPKGLGAIDDRIPALEWVTVASEQNLAALGELGVVFLLFLIGLELTLNRLVTMRKLIFGLGFLQVALSALAIGAVAQMLGAKPESAVVLGLSLALSSTAIVVELMSQQHRLPTATGRASFAILLAQDLAVVPLILLATIFGAGQTGSVTGVLISALAQAALAIGVIVAIGTTVLRPLFRLVASNGNTEIFVAAVLLVAVGSGLLTAAVGLSMALGAFVAGLLLAETEYRRAIEATLEPFKGLLLGVFFFTVGMSLDVAGIIGDPLPVVAGVVGLVALKGAIVIGLMRAFGFRWTTAAEAALLLGPGGEFAFIVIGMALASGFLSQNVGAVALAITSLSMALIPVLDYFGRRAIEYVKNEPEEEEPTDPALLALPAEEARPRAIVVGYGRVGALISDMLDRHNVPHVITERMPKLVTEGRGDGRPVYFGDATNATFLKSCGLATASAVIITIHTWKEVDGLIRAIRSVRPDIVIVARSRDAEHARHLYDIGVTDAVPETIEASLQLSEAALVGIGVPTGPVIASIHEKRDEFRETLQRAARDGGRPTSHAVKPKQTPRPAAKAGG